MKWVFNRACRKLTSPFHSIMAFIYIKTWPSQLDPVSGSPVGRIGWPPLLIFITLQAWYEALNLGSHRRSAHIRSRHCQGSWVVVHSQAAYLTSATILAQASQLPFCGLQPVRAAIGIHARSESIFIDFFGLHDAWVVRACSSASWSADAEPPPLCGAHYADFVGSRTTCRGNSRASHLVRTVGARNQGLLAEPPRRG
jgi:hypothetical protein